MKSFQAYLLLLIFFSALPEGMAQATAGDTLPPLLPLDSVLTRIEQSNPMLQESDYKSRALDTYVEGARSLMPPTVGVGVFMAPYNRAMADEMSMGEDLGSVMFSAEQMFSNPAKRRAKRDYLSARSSVERETRNYQFNQLRAQAKTLYYESAVLEKRRQLLEENQEIIRFMIRLAQVRYPYNQGKLNSIYDAQGRLYELDNERLMLEGQARLKGIALNTLMNRPVDTPFRVDTSAINRVSPLPLMLDTAAVAAARSDIRRLDRTIEVMRLNQKMEASMRKPDFGIRYEHMGNMGTMPNQFTLMGMVTLPLVPWAAKEYRANVKAMNWEIQAMQRGREGLINEANGMLATMRTEVQTRQKQVENYQQRTLPTLKKNYQVALLSYEQNTAELIQVIAAWETLNMAQMRYLDTLDELLKMQVAYEREMEK